MGEHERLAGKTKGKNQLVKIKKVTGEGRCQKKHSREGAPATIQGGLGYIISSPI